MRPRLITACGLFFLLCACSAPVDKPPGFTLPLQAEMQGGFVYVDTVAPLVKTELKYSGNDNFIGRPLVGYHGKRAILRIETALALKAVSEDIYRSGYMVIHNDAYRPHPTMKDICNWGLDVKDTKMKARFYPNIDKKRIFEDKYVGPFSEHSAGIAVDVSLLYADTGLPVDMGGHHDLLDPSSATCSALITPQQRKNRLILHDAFKRHGFSNYKLEWWHYWLKGSPYANLHYSFPVWDGMRPRRENP